MGGWCFAEEGLWAGPSQVKWDDYPGHYPDDSADSSDGPSIDYFQDPEHDRDDVDHDSSHPGPARSGIESDAQYEA